MASVEERTKAVKAVEAIFERYRLIAEEQNFNGFDRHLMEASSLHSTPYNTEHSLIGDLHQQNSKIITATPDGKAEFEFAIDERYGNMNGVMHGGAAGVIFDMFTTIALGPIARPGWWDFLGGVTRTLNISYLKAIPVGTTVRLRSKVTGVGRTMAMIRGTMTSVDGKTIYCTAEHHKVRVPTQAEHSKHRVAWDDLWDAEGKEIIKSKI